MLVCGAVHAAYFPLCRSHSGEAQLISDGPEKADPGDLWAGQQEWSSSFAEPASLCMRPKGHWKKWHEGDLRLEWLQWLLKMFESQEFTCSTWRLEQRESPLRPAKGSLALHWGAWKVLLCLEAGGQWASSPLKTKSPCFKMLWRHRGRDRSSEWGRVDSGIPACARKLRISPFRTCRHIHVHTSIACIPHHTPCTPTCMHNAHITHIHMHIHIHVACTRSCTRTAITHIPYHHAHIYHSHTTCTPHINTPNIPHIHACTHISHTPHMHTRISHTLRHIHHTHHTHLHHICLMHITPLTHTLVPQMHTPHSPIHHSTDKYATHQTCSIPHTHTHMHIAQSEAGFGKARCSR
jgi:hypothetical protein